MKLTAEHISKSFETEQVLDDISLSLEEGKIVAVVGASGVGKTTLFNIIAGTLAPDGGSITLNGEDITGCPGRVSYMPQKDLLFPYKTILDNVALPLRIRGEKKKTARQKARSYFEEFGLSGTEKKYPAQISGGMKQRAAFLRTYLFSSEVALLDEPFSALDAMTKQQMHQWFLSMAEELNLSALLITHDIDEAILLADRIYVLSGSPGKIVAELGIGIPRPRSRETVLSDSFVFYKRKIMEVLG